MKSTGEELKGRGMATEHEITALSKLPLMELVMKLHNAEPSIRSAATINLRSNVDKVADELLTQLSREKCLYTRIAICESLENGNLETARKMTDFLGCIGNNQHKVLPNKVSMKKSFPLPRDIIARSLGRMDISVFPVLLDVMESNHTEQICEIFDAIGYMVFYNPILATEKNCEQIISSVAKYEASPMILWKMILCFSSFPCKESRNILLRFEKEKSILGLEAQRSLEILGNRNGFVNFII